MNKIELEFSTCRMLITFDKQDFLGVMASARKKKLTNEHFLTSFDDKDELAN